MPTPSKPVSVIRSEGKSHRTKAELAAREAAEESTKSGKKIAEQSAVREDKIAHRVFLKVKKMLADIERDDKLYEAVINRYCLITAECEAITHDRQLIEMRCEHLEDALKNREIEMDAYIKAHEKAVDQKAALDRALQQKRRMLLGIERENLMTIAAAMRAIPKEQKDEIADDPMSRMLASRMGK